MHAIVIPNTTPPTPLDETAMLTDKGHAVVALIRALKQLHALPATEAERPCMLQVSSESVRLAFGSVGRFFVVGPPLAKHCVDNLSRWDAVLQY